MSHQLRKVATIESVGSSTRIEGSKLSDKDAEYGRKDIVSDKGFYILPSELFVNVVKNAKNDPNLNETIQQVFKNIESSANGTESEDDIK